MTKRLLDMRWLLFLTALSVARPVAAADGIPFPELKTDAYCRELVAKMLDKTEQKIEGDKCLVDQKVFKDKIKPLWHLLDKNTQEYIVSNYFKEERYHTYLTIWQYVGDGVGRACLDGRMTCKPQVASTDETFTLLRSDFYCHAKAASADKSQRPAALSDCLASERRLKTQLGLFWDAIRVETKSYCLQYFHTVKQSPFRVLSDCAASDIGQRCLVDELDCRLN